MFWALFSLVVLVFLFYLSKKNSDHRPLRPFKIHRHGHRCYIDHLNFNERHIVNLLANNLNHKEYFIFNNIILPSENSKTTQVDHIVVSRYGIFVIESKRFNHWIFGNPNHKEWTQTTYTGRKHRFYNPLLQNFAHVSALKQQLPFLKNVFFDLVVFSGDCTFKTPRIDKVLYEHEMIDYIKSKNNLILKEVELLVVIGKLSLLCQTSETSNEEHAENIRSYVSTLRQHMLPQ